MSSKGKDRASVIREALAQYERPLVSYAWRLTGELESARDVVQDAFLQLCRQKPGAVDGHVGPWLYRVCRNRALDVMKKERRMTSLTAEAAAAFPSAGPGPSSAAAGNEIGDAIRSAVEGLPEKQQEVFRLKFQHQMSYQQISEITGHELNHVRYLIHITLKTLREELRGQLDLAGAR